MERLKPLIGRALQYLSILASRGLGTALQFLAQVVVGQLLGPTSLGALSVAQSWTSMLGTIGSAGSPSFVLRRTALKAGRQATRGRAGWLVFGWITSTIGALATAAGFCIWLAFNPQHIPQQGGLLLVGVLIAGAIGFSIARVHMEELKGRGRVRQAVMMEFSTPFLIVVLVALLVFATDRAVAIWAVPAAYVSAFVINAGIFTRAVFATSMGASWGRDWLRRIRRSWKELATLLGVDLGNQLTAALPILLLAASTSLAEAAVLGVSMRLIGVTATISATLTAQASRSVISAYRTGDRKAVRALYLKGIVSNGLLSALVLLPMIFFPRLCLLPFGEALVSAEAAQVLMIMAALRLIRQFFGLSQLFLMAAGRGQLDLISQAISVAIMFSVLAGFGRIDLMSVAVATSAATLARGGLSWLMLAVVVRPMSRGER